MFITFEGLDFSGKSTQARRFVDRLRAESVIVQLLREPGGTPLSERVRALLLERGEEVMHPLAEVLLFEASRAQLVHAVIRPALARGETVVCDRYYDSTTAYQGHGRGISLEAIAELNRIASGHLVPDITLLMDIPLEEISRRQRIAGATSDRMESAGRAFYERVRAGFLHMAEAEPARFVRVDGMGNVDTVAEMIWSVYRARVRRKDLA